MDLMAIYSNLKKCRGRARILASTIEKLKDGPLTKLVFVRDRRKKDWLALICTDIELANEDVIRIYGKRWDIEVFFKMAKQHLKLTKEIQCRDYDALIAHTSIVLHNCFGKECFGAKLWSLNSFWNKRYSMGFIIIVYGFVYMPKSAKKRS